MADEKKNSSIADSILAETASLYEDEVKAVAEPEVEEKEEVKEEPKEEKKSDKKTSKKADKKPEKKEEKKDDSADDILDEVFGDSEEVKEEPQEEEKTVPVKSEAVAAIEAKEAAKLARKNEREQQQAAKRNAKRARLQALIDQCPNEYKPVSTSKFFWYGVFCNLPCIGFIITILFSIFPINKNVKNFARSILIVYLIGIILSLISMIVLFFLTPNEEKNEILSGLNKIVGAFT